jgi:hypothetical protein
MNDKFESGDVFLCRLPISASDGSAHRLRPPGFERLWPRNFAQRDARKRRLNRRNPEVTRY